MSRNVYPQLLLLVGLFCCESVLSGQVHRTATPKATASGAPPAASPAGEVEAAFVQQQRALTSGDPATIAATSKALHAVALRQLAQIARVRGDEAREIDLDRRATALAPSATGHLELASALLRSGDAKAAADEALTATEMDSASATAWAVRGGALRAAKRDEDAAVALQESLRLQANADVAYALGSTLLALHEKAKADVVFQQIIKASGEAAISYLEVGDAYREAEYMPEAIVAFEEALRRDPRVPHADFFLGLTYLQMHAWSPNPESLQHLREAVRLAPRDYVSNFYLGALESTAGSDLASSDRHLRTAAEVDPSQPEVWLYLGLNANREHRTAEAKSDLRRSIELTGKDEARNNYQVRKAYFALGRLLMADGEREEGSKLLARYSAAEQAAVAQSGEKIQVRSDTGGARNDPATAIDPDMPAHASGLAALTKDSGVAGGPGEQGSAPPRLKPEEERALRGRETALRHVLATSGNDLGTAEAREQQYDEALATFQEAEQWETPPMPALLRNEGTAAFRVKQFDEAARALTQYFELTKVGEGREQGAKTGAEAAGDERARVMLATSQFSTGKFAEAAQNFAAASAATRSDSRTAYAWAYSLARTGQAQEANRLAEELTRQPLPIDQRMLVCHVFVDTENYEGSAACYRQAYAEDATVRLAHFQVGEALVRLDRAAEAVPELQAELRLTPEDANVQYALAFALLQMSHKEDAQRMLEGIVGAHPEQAEAQYQLGKLLLEQGKTSEAIVHIEAAERASAASPAGTPDYVHYQLGTAYRKAGRVTDSDREFRLYREIKDQKRAGAASRD